MVPQVLFFDRQYLLGRKGATVSNANIQILGSIITGISTLLGVGVTLYFANRTQHRQWVIDKSLDSYVSLQTRHGVLMRELLEWQKLAVSGYIEWTSRELGMAESDPDYELSTYDIPVKTYINLMYDFSESVNRCQILTKNKNLIDSLNRLESTTVQAVRGTEREVESLVATRGNSSESKRGELRHETDRVARDSYDAMSDLILTVRENISAVTRGSRRSL